MWPYLVVGGLAWLGFLFYSLCLVRAGADADRQSAEALRANARRRLADSCGRASDSTEHENRFI